MGIKISFRRQTARWYAEPLLESALVATVNKNSVQSRPPLKQRSQSATEGMAARGGLGPTTINAHTYSMSPAITLERHATVKFEPTTRSLDLPRSIDLPRSPVRQSDQKQTQFPKTTSSPLKRNPAKAKSDGWLSKLFAWKSNDRTKEDTKQYP